MMAGKVGRRWEKGWARPAGQGTQGKGGETGKEEGETNAGQM